MPYTLKSIEKNAFEYCSIESLTIPASVVKIGYEAFKDCGNLKTVVFEDITSKWYNRGRLYNSDSYVVMDNSVKNAELLVSELGTWHKDETNN